jgi:hypothetical protein
MSKPHLSRPGFEKHMPDQARRGRFIATTRQRVSAVSQFELPHIRAHFCAACFDFGSRRWRYPKGGRASALKIRFQDDEALRRNSKPTAQCEPSAYPRDGVSDVRLSAPDLSPAKRKVAMFVAALGLATASFWAVIQPSTPQTAAPEGANVPVFEIMRNGPLGLSELNVDAI